MITKIGAKEFKERVKTTLMQIDGNIKEDDLYFSQTTSGYYIEYKPKYPNRSNADFIVYQDLAGSISVHGNMSALVPTIQHYNNIDDFEHSLSGEKCIKCYNLITDEFFQAVSGKMCVDCIKDLGVYHALKSLGMINHKYLFTFEWTDGNKSACDYIIEHCQENHINYRYNGYFELEADYFRTNNYASFEYEKISGDLYGVMIK